MKDIAGYNSFLKLEPINKGWSSDKKYYIEDKNGKRLLLRIADVTHYDRRKSEFESMKQVAALGIPMSQPLDSGDPWEEFNRIVWTAAVSPHFATGQLNGYFGGRPPIEFFKLLAFYIASNTLSSIYWSITFGEDEITTMKNQTKDILYWFDNMNNPIPTWYYEK